MRHVAVITARGGSKRVPGKNVKPLGGRPLLAWTIARARAAACFDRVTVSTDSEAIASVAVEHGAEVPFLRAPELATDDATSADVLVDHVQRLRLGGDVVLTLLQPTSPFRTVETIRRAVREVEAVPGSSLIGVTPAPIPLEWHRRVEPDGSMHALEIPRCPPGSTLCVFSGIIFVTTVESLVRHRNLYGERPRAFLVEDRIESLDIDTNADWTVAEALVNSGAVASVP